MSKCEDCMYWDNKDNERVNKELGICKKLSKEKPNINEVGIVGMPLCLHDGCAIYFETHSWFGCVHFSDK